MEALAVEAMKTLLEENRARFFATLHQDCRAQLMIRDQDGKFPTFFDAILADAGVSTSCSAVSSGRG